MTFKKQALLLLMVLWIDNSFSQDISVKRLQNEISRSIKKDITDTTNWTWLRGGLVNVNISQGSLSNWAAGGDRFSLAVNSYLNYFIFYRKVNHTWDNNLDFNFGLLQSTSVGSRKNDDRLDLLSKYGINVDKRFFLTGLFNFRTQFFDGHSYSGNKSVFSSTFLSPAYVLTSLGVDFKPNTNFSAFVSPVTSRWVIVASNYLARKGAYGVDSGKHSINEFGAFASINFKTGIYKNVTYKGRMDLFSNYRFKPGNVDIYMTNFFSFRINKYFSGTYNLDLIYDDDVKLFGDEGKSPALQLKSLIGIGFLMRFK